MRNIGFLKAERHGKWIPVPFLLGVKYLIEKIRPNRVIVYLIK